MIKLVPIAKELDTARARPMYLSATMLVFGEGRRPAATEWEDGCEVQANPASADCKEGIVPRVAKINRRPEHCNADLRRPESEESSQKYRSTTKNSKVD